MNQIPAYLQNYEARDVGADLSRNLGSAMPPHVSIESNRFTLIDASNNEIPVPTFDPQIGVYLDAAIIDVNQAMSRMYYARPYDPSQAASPPDCWSDNGVAPSIGASSPQSPTCAACPQAVWGSKINPNGKKVPACSQKQKVALLIPGFNTLFLLAVPPNSHSYMREYVEKCRGSQINMANLITRISFVPGIQGTLQFHPVTYIDEATAKLRQAAYAEKKTDALVGRNDEARPAGAVLGQPGIIPPPNASTPQNSTGQAPLLSIQPGSTMQVQQPAQQVQQPAPFVQHQPAQNAGWPGSPGQPAPTAATSPPSEAAQPARRRRRTAAEMQAANGAAPGEQPAPAPAAAPQAPFPNPGQAAQAQPAQFGIATGQPAGADPAIQTMLDDFFKG
jgi:hypothetical protein